MTGKMQFDFIVDRNNNTMTIRREFAASRQLVWDCYTKQELLDQWFAPKPMTTKTKELNFSEGGHWIYAMIDAEGNEYWGRMDYQTISPIDGYTGLDGFCNDKGELNPDLPRAKWDVSFHSKGNHTVVETIVAYKAHEDLEVVIQMGMEEGMGSTLARLDELLIALTR